MKDIIGAVVIKVESIAEKEVKLYFDNGIVLEVNTYWDGYRETHVLDWHSYQEEPVEPTQYIRIN